MDLQSIGHAAFIAIYVDYPCYLIVQSESEILLPICCRICLTLIEPTDEF